MKRIADDRRSSESGTVLDGTMIPRATRRSVDQRGETRYKGVVDNAVLTARARDKLVRVVNISSEGAMLAPAASLRIGEPVSLRLAGDIHVAGAVRWIRDGCMGVNFSVPLVIEEG